MTLYCRCDNSVITNGVCDVCGGPERETPRQLVHKAPPPILMIDNRSDIVEKPPWTNCPSCGCGPGVEHDKRCPKAAWNNATYRARKLT
jgi:hypothetical protein